MAGERHEGPDEVWLARAIETLRAPAGLDPGYLDRTLAELPPRSRREPRRYAPFAWPLGAAAALAILIGLGRSVGTPGGEDREAVEFNVAATGARVVLVGDFNDWNPSANPLERRGEGWRLTLRLPPGRYRYAYLVDGRRWLPDPGLPAAEDDFGTPTSVITVAR